MDRPVTDIAAYVEQSAVDAAEVERLRERLTATIRRFEVPLDDTDWANIDRFHRRFIEAGLGLQFQSTGRAPQWHYPTLGDLLLATDGAGRQAHFLASEASFRFVKDLQERDRIIPVVGDLAGPTAMRAIGRFLAAERIPLSTFYASNVEFYLWRQGVHERFVDNLRSLPRGERAMLIRSIFSGDGSVSEIEPIARLTRR